MTLQRGRSKSALIVTWWAIDYCRYWLLPAFIRRHLRDRGY